MIGQSFKLLRTFGGQLNPRLVIAETCGKKKGYAHRRGLRKGPLIAEARGHLPSKHVYALNNWRYWYCSYYCEHIRVYCLVARMNKLPEQWPRCWTILSEHQRAHIHSSHSVSYLATIRWQRARWGTGRPSVSKTSRPTSKYLRSKRVHVTLYFFFLFVCRYVRVCVGVWLHAGWDGRIMCNINYFHTTYNTLSTISSTTTSSQRTRASLLLAAILFDISSLYSIIEISLLSYIHILTSATGIHQGKLTSGFYSKVEGRSKLRATGWSK